MSLNFCSRCEHVFQTEASPTSRAWTVCHQCFLVLSTAPCSSTCHSHSECPECPPLAKCRELHGCLVDPALKHLIPDVAPPVVVVDPSLKHLIKPDSTSSNTTVLASEEKKPGPTATTVPANSTDVQSIAADVGSTVAQSPVSSSADTALSGVLSAEKQAGPAVLSEDKKPASDSPLANTVSSVAAVGNTGAVSTVSKIAYSSLMTTSKSPGVCKTCKHVFQSDTLRVRCHQCFLSKYSYSCSDVDCLPRSPECPQCPSLPTCSGRHQSLVIPSLKHLVPEAPLGTTHRDVVATLRMEMEALAAKVKVLELIVENKTSAAATVGAKTAVPTAAMPTAAMPTAAMPAATVPSPCLTPATPQDKKTVDLAEAEIAEITKHWTEVGRFIKNLTRDKT